MNWSNTFLRRLTELACFPNSGLTRRLVGLMTGVVAIVAVVAGSPLMGQTDTSFTYQGELMDNGNLADGSFNLNFSLWNAANAGSQIGLPIALNGVSVVDGKFSVELDFGPSAFDNSDRWLQIAVNGVTLAPRNPITRAPYAIQTRGINVADDQDVSIGTTSNLYRFQVFANDRERAIYGNNFDNSTGVKHGVYGRATSVDGFGLYGLHDASTGTNAGVYGETDSTSANAVGVHGVVDTTSAGNFSAAVRGENRGTGLPGIGVYGSHDGQGWGVYGSTEGGFGRGVFGEVLGTGGVAGYFSNDSGTAVFADGVENNGSTAALTVVSGAQTMLIDGNEIDSNSSAGLYFNNNNDHHVLIANGGGNVAIGSTDVLGQKLSVESDELTTLRATNTRFGGTGISGISSNNGNGVEGFGTSQGAYGVFSVGDIGATGVKSFIQPHPSDPSKEIRFVCLEGNESGTYFRGSNSLVNGRAYIEVPEEFRLVTELDGLTVQLTAMGPGGDLWVESKNLDQIIVMGNVDVEFDYFVNGVRRGFADLELTRENQAYVPEVFDVPFGTQYTEGLRRVLVENGILNSDFTPNKETAAALGWTLREPKLHEKPPTEEQANSSNQLLLRMRQEMKSLKNYALRDVWLISN